MHTSLTDPLKHDPPVYNTSDVPTKRFFFFSQKNNSKMKSGSSDYITKQSQVTVDSPALVQDIFV